MQQMKYSGNELLEICTLLVISFGLGLKVPRTGGPRLNFYCQPTTCIQVQSSAT